MEAMTTSTEHKNKLRINTADLPNLLHQYSNNIKVLSLDCFDTLLWRMTATPREVFYDMQQKPIFESYRVTAYQRIKAAARAYRHKFITDGHRQITLSDIYQSFSTLTPDQKNTLVEAELSAEMDICYAYPAMVELLREAHKRGLKIIIVSDTYFTETQLQRLLNHALPNDVKNIINKIFCSCEFTKSKSDGLFELVQKDLNIPANEILHIGDHQVADFESPRKMGLNALHFIQFPTALSQFLRMQHITSPLISLSNVNIQYKRPPAYSPFRGIFASSNITAEKPETSIGYMSFGPMLFAFARFITDEIAALEAAGKRPKVFFLLRDAYLLSRACEIYSGNQLGKLVRIRKFVSIAASFHSQADVDYYISGIEPQHFNIVVICEQLLLPRELIEKIIQLCSTSTQPEQLFYQMIHQPAVLKLIFNNSAAYRERLRRYILREMAVEEGDTVVLVDTGYIGVTQDFFTRTFKDDLKIEVTGRYFMGSHEPDRPDCKSLMTSSWCEHGLFEQSCTYKEGCVLDYDNDGNPIFDKIKLSDQQYEKVAALQAECLRFIHDAKHFFATSQSPSYNMLQQAAMAALKRHIFFPNESEIQYFQTYQHDKDMGPTLTKTMYNVNDGLTMLRQEFHPIKLHPYEARSASLHLTLSSLLQQGFDLDFGTDDMSFYGETIKIFVLSGADTKQIQVKAMQTYDGYFIFNTPLIHQEQLSIIFGEHYQWLQINSVKLIGNQIPVNSSIDRNIILDGLVGHGGNLFTCQSHSSSLTITPLALANTNNGYYYQIVFRPIVRW